MCGYERARSSLTTQNSVIKAPMPAKTNFSSTPCVAALKNCPQQLYVGREALLKTDTSHLSCSPFFLLQPKIHLSPSSVYKMQQSLERCVDLKRIFLTAYVRSRSDSSKSVYIAHLFLASVIINRKSKIHLHPCHVRQKYTLHWPMCGGAQKGFFSTHMCGGEVAPQNRHISLIFLSVLLTSAKHQRSTFYLSVGEKQRLP